MRIAHIKNVANIGAVLASTQRRLGHEAFCLQILRRLQGFKGDENLDLPKIYPIYHLPGRLVKIWRALSNLKGFDIYHLHDGGIFPKDIDVPLIFKRRGKVCVHWHGTKLRNKGRRFSRHADLVFVSTPDLLKMDENAVWMPNPIDMKSLPEPEFRESMEGNPIRIVHVPTDRKIKGTEGIISDVNALKREGYNLELRLIENMPHEEVLGAIRGSDIVVDWINPDFGIYGLVSIEGMALGKPVLNHIKEEYLPFYTDCPIVNTDAEGLRKNLRYLIEDEGARRDIGRQGRTYVEKIHDAEKVAEKVIARYEMTLHR